MLLNRYIYTYFQITICLLLAVASGFLTPVRPSLPHASYTTSPGSTKQVVMILVDAMRTDYAFNPTLMPNLTRLAKEGVSGTARTGTFPMTTAGIRAVTSGTSYSTTDITNNLIKTWPGFNIQKNNSSTEEKKSENTLKAKDFFRQTYLKEFKTSIEDSILRQASEKGLITVLSGLDTWLNLFGKDIKESVVQSMFDSKHDFKVHKAALNFIEKNNFNILIVHYLGLDKIGHNATPLSSESRAKAVEIDGYIGDIEKHLNPDTTLFVFSDHGMSDKGGHSYDDYGKLPIVTEAPFIFAKHAIGHKQNLSIQQIDFAPTLALMLGISIPTYSEGIPVIDVFDINDKEKALKILEYQQVQLNNLQQIQKQTGIYFDIPASNFQKEFDNENFLSAVEIAKKEAKEITLLQKIKIQFHVPILTQIFIIISFLAVILLWFIPINEFPLIALPRIAIPWLSFSLLIAFFISRQSNSLAFFHCFLIEMLGWISCVALFSIYKLINCKDLNSRNIFTICVLILCLLFFLTPFGIFLINTLIALSIFTLIFVGAKNNIQLQINLTFSTLIVIGLNSGIHFVTTSNNKLFHLAAFGIFLIFLIYYLTHADKLLRIITIVSFIVSFALISKIIGIFNSILFLTCAVFAIEVLNTKRKRILGKRIYFLEGSLGLLALYQIQTWTTLALVEKYNESLKMTGVATLLSICLLYIFYNSLVKTKKIQKLNRLEISVLIFSVCVLLTTFIGRIPQEFYFRNKLGKVILIQIIIAITAASFIRLHYAVKNYFLYVLTMLFTVLTFEPIYILFILVTLFLETYFIYKTMRIFKRNSLISFGLYTILSMFIYYTCYRSLSSTSMFEESRRAIIGAEIIDYSNWNIMIIAIFLTIKVIAIELTALLPFIHYGIKLDRVITQYVAILCIGICFVISILWWQYTPENSSILSLLVASLVFLSVRMVVLTLILFFTNSIFKRKYIQHSPKTLITTNELLPMTS